ncbi:MAG TPA: ankyrin repeat domain-containing protein [Puia sp.]|nr:ankyrin repeat domain-containing protein [Puia sp.]
MLPKPFYFDDAIWGADTWPLLSAAYIGDLEAVKHMLVDDPTRVHAQYAYYEPLHYAVRGGSLPMVELLLRNGAHPAAPGWSRLGDETPLAKARYRRREDMVTLLERATAAAPPYQWPSKRPFTADEQRRFDFEIACGYTPDIEHVRRVIAEHPGWATDGLYESIHHDRMEITQLLLNAGGDPNGFMPFACWFTPLMHTLRYEEPRWAMAELLLDHGVPINGINGLGMTALHIVVAMGTVRAAKCLLDHGANPNAIEPEFSSTPLGWAARWHRADMTELLLDYY